jgi:hypothetical protein
MPFLPALSCLPFSAHSALPFCLSLFIVAICLSFALLSLGHLGLRDEDLTLG